MRHSRDWVVLEDRSAEVLEEEHCIAARDNVVEEAVRMAVVEVVHTIVQVADHTAVDQIVVDEEDREETAACMVVDIPGGVVGEVLKEELHNNPAEEDHRTTWYLSCVLQDETSG